MKRIHCRRLILWSLLIAWGASFSSAQEGSENWPRLRGPFATGLPSNTKNPNLPDTWSKTENIAWQVDVPGVGWSSPVVWAMDLSKLGETGTADNLEAYLNAHGAAIPRRQMAGMLNPHCECFGELQISTQRQLSRNGSATRIFRPGSTIKDQKPEDSPTFRVRY